MPKSTISSPPDGNAQSYQREWSPLQRWFIKPAGICTVVLLLSGVVALVAKWFFSVDVLDAWWLVATASSGLVLLAIVVLFRELRRVLQVLAGFTGILLLILFWDMLDGSQQFLPIESFFLWLWAVAYIDMADEIRRRSSAPKRQKLVALILSCLVALGYIAAAVYYVVLNRIAGPIDIQIFGFFLFGVIFLRALRMVGGVSQSTALSGVSESTALNGPKRVCPQCGLRNIAERSVCKRCGFELHGVAITEN